METLQIALFAKLDIQRGDTPIGKLPAKAEELLCYLLLHRRQPHTREALACTLWPDAPAAQSKKYLRQCLWQIHQAFDRPESVVIPLLHLDHEWVAIHPDASLQVDAWQFEQAFAAVHNQPGDRINGSQAQAAMQAAALYTGELLTGWYHQWCLIERVRFESLCVALLDKLMAYCGAHGLFDQGIAYGMRLLQYDDTREQTHQQLMQVYQLVGDRTAALRQFAQCSAALAKEFGVQPTEQTLALYAQIRTGQGATTQAERLTAFLPHADPGMLATLLTELASLRDVVARLQGDLDEMKQATHRP